MSWVRQEHTPFWRSGLAIHFLPDDVVDFVLGLPDLPSTGEDLNCVSVLVAVQNKETSHDRSNRRRYHRLGL